MWLFNTIFLLSLVNLIFSDIIDTEPQQVHIAFGEDVTEVTVTWSTVNETSKSIVEYGIGGFVLSANGTATLFVDGGKMKKAQYIHRVKLTNLSPDSRYVYHCGSPENGWSDVFWFKTPPSAENWQPSFAIFGDMGNENAQSLPRLQEETIRGMYDAILHVGDFAYDMDWYEGETGDQFMRQIQPIAAYLPYMVCPGNHEQMYNFSHYRNRFSMPGGTENIMYSINLGPIHLISISTELYYFLNYGIKPLVFQFEWLKQDLIKANLPENRAKQPWIVVMGHRPMYCSTTDNDDCNHHETATRVGLPFLHFFGLEDLFYNYGVDLQIWAHEHIYQRLWPIYNYQVYNGSYEEPYTNPKAPVHIITGSAGCRENHDEFNQTIPSWSAFTTRDYGYTRMKVYNASHIHLEQVSVEKEGAVIDSFWLIKDKHVAYPLSKMDWADVDSMRMKNFNV